jgi:hypothetical protein
MFFNSAKSQITESDTLSLIWESGKGLATKGQFEEIHFLETPTGKQTVDDVAGGIDSQTNRLVVLDPRYWSLLNGDDGKSRSDIRRLFGLGDSPMIVDNAASCVVVAANTYQRRYAIQAAQEVLTWRLVAGQIVEDDERADVQRKLAEAESKLKEKVRGAFRHYAYLTRKRDQLEVVFARFDDDKLTSLNGNDVWGALVAANRAVGEYIDAAEKRRKRMKLSEVFIALLLDSFDRHLTPKDVLSSFYKDPRFPLVPTLDEIRQVIYDLIQPPGHADPGTGGWELVGSDGVSLHVEGPKQLAINSIQQQLRRTKTAVDEIDSRTETHNVKNIENSSGGRASDAVRMIDANEGRGGLGKKPESYSWYRVEVTNRSITDETRREAIRAHLVWLASKLDDDTLDHQLISLKYELMAGTNPSLTDDFKARAKAIQANKAEVESET